MNLESSNGAKHLQWCTIESDPEIFTKLLLKYGVSDVQVEEIYDLAGMGLYDFDKVLGLVFLFKWDEHSAESTDTISNDVYFARQIVKDACATQALISILLNTDADLGSQLAEFKAKTMAMSPDERGMAIGTAEFLRNAHNSFDDSVNLKQKSADHGAAAFHFVAYVPVNKTVYELDGLKNYPRKVGTVEDETKWFESAIRDIESRIERANNSSSNEIRFALLAVLKSRVAVIEELIGAGKRAELDFEIGGILSDEKKKRERLVLINKNPLLEMALSSLGKIPPILPKK